MSHPDNLRHLGESECLDLAHGLLSGREQALLLEHVRECADCERRLQSTVVHRERARARAAAAWGHQSRAFRPKSLWSRLWPAGRYVRFSNVAPALAAVAMALLSVQVFRDEGSGGVVSDVLKWLPEGSQLVVSRGVSSSTRDSALVLGLRAYDERRLTAAIGYLRAAQTTDQLDVVRLAYLGNALVRTGAAQEGAGTLEAIASGSLPEPWLSETRLALALAWIQTGKQQRADSLVSILADGPADVATRAGRLRPPPWRP